MRNFTLTLLFLLASCLSVFAPARAQKAELVVQLGHTKGIYSVKYSPDGKTLVSAGDTTVKLWDVATGKLLRTLQGHTGEVYSVTYSPDGKALASGSADSTVKLWDVATGKLLRTLQGHTDGVSSVSYSPDGKTLVSAGLFDSTVTLWDVATGKLQRTLQGHTDGIKSTSYSPDGKTLASGSGDNTVKLWDVGTGKLLRTLQGHTGDMVSSVSYSPDGKTLASAGGYDKTIMIWDVATGKLLRTLQGHDDRINRITYSPDGKTLASGSADRTITLWDVTTGKQLQTLQGHTGEVNSVSYSPNGKTLASGSWGGDRAIKLWDVATGKLLQTVESHTARISSVSYSPDGKTLASGSWDNTVSLWDMATGKLLRNSQGDGRRIGGVTYSPDGKTLASGGDSTAVKLWDVATGNLLQTLQSYTSHNDHSIMYSPDGKTLASGSGDSVTLWDVATGKLLQDLHGNSVSYAPDGKTLASGSNDNSVKLWDIATGKLLRTLQDHVESVDNASYSPIDSVCYSLDGKTLASGGWDNTVKLWDVATGKLLRTLQGHTEKITSVVYSPDGKTLASGSEDNTVKLWDAATGKLLRTLQGHTQSVTSVSYSPDGKTLASGSWDTSIRFWNLSSATPTALTAYTFDSGDSVVVDDQGRFDGTPGGLEQLHYVVALEPIVLEQLKERYYTPGLWEKTLGNDKDALPAVPKFNEVALYPDIEIVPPAPGETKLQVRLKNQGGGLGRVEIKVGGKELLADARGKGFNDKAATQTLEVDLSGTGASGQKVPVEVVAWNAEGDVRSRGARLEYQPPGQRKVVKPRFYAIVVGTSRFPNNPQLDLRFSSKDASDMAKALELGAQGLFESAQIHLLSSDAATPADKPTRENIARVFAEVAQEAREGDVLVAYFSGHGVGLRVEGRDYYCYLTQDARDISEAAFADPQVRATVAITSEDLAQWTNPKTGIKAQKQVLILDTCAAGAVAARLDQQKDTDADVVRAVDRLNERSGFYVLMGCAASAQSFEANLFDQGILTYSLLQGVKGAALRDGRFVDISKLFSFAQDGAENLAKSVGLSQQPRTMAGSGQSFDIGELDDAKKNQIPLARAKPVLLRPTLQNEIEGFDNLELAAPVQSALREACLSAARGDGTPNFLAVEPGEFAEGIKPTINYRVEGDIVKARVIFSQKGKKLSEVNIEGPADAGKRGELTDNIVKALIAARFEP